MAKKQKLTDKQKAFVNEYLVDFNATQAAIRAKYSKKTAKVIGPENLSKPYIQEAIAEKRKQLAKKENIASVEEIMEGYTRDIRFDPRKLYGDDGHLKDVPDLDDDTALGLAGLKVTETVVLSDKKTKVIKRVYEYKLPDKKANRDSMKKVFGMDAPEKINHGLDSDSTQAIIDATKSILGEVDGRTRNK
jgi:phage terminase small subunit